MLWILTHVSLLKCFIPKHIFSTYNIPNRTVVGLNLNYVNKVLAQIRNTDELIMIFEEDKMDITVINSITKNFMKLNLLIMMKKN